MEFVDYLKSPKKYQHLGAQIPKGAQYLSELCVRARVKCVCLCAQDVSLATCSTYVALGQPKLGRLALMHSCSCAHEAAARAPGTQALHQQQEQQFTIPLNYAEL
eukprot:1160380-Pelagomonas_calceolata.AAC.5